MQEMHTLFSGFILHNKTECAGYTFYPFVTEGYSSMYCVNLYRDKAERDSILIDLKKIWAFISICNYIQHKKKPMPLYTWYDNKKRPINIKCEQGFAKLYFNKLNEERKHLKKHSVWFAMYLQQKPQSSAYVCLHECYKLLLEGNTTLNEMQKADLKVLEGAKKYNARVVESDYGEDNLGAKCFVPNDIMKRLENFYLDKFKNYYQI